VVQRVTVVADKSSEWNEVTIAWQGGMETRHHIARPIGTFEQLKDFKHLTKRIRELHASGLPLAEIAAALNDEGFVPPRRRGGFTKAGIGPLVRDLGLTGELFRDDLVEKDEWWIPDLAHKLGVIPQKIHYWVKQAWIHARRTPSEKHLIVWADAEEMRRLKRLAAQKNSWIAARHPDWIVPKNRPAR